MVIVIVLIVLMLYSNLPFSEQEATDIDSTQANGSTVDESRYHNFGLDSEIPVYMYLKIPVKGLISAQFKRAFDSLFFRAFVKKNLRI